MSDMKIKRRQRNAEAGAVGKLGRDRQSAMMKALQSMERVGDADASGRVQDELTPSSSLQSGLFGHNTVYPTKGHRWVDPDVCRPWRLADRPDTEALHVDDLAQSFDREGQVAAAIVRPVRDPEQPEIRYEIIAGYVRWKAALKIRRQLLVDIRSDLDDRTAFSIMSVENDLRQGLSDYTKAKRYQRALAEGLYASKGELAEAMGLSNTQLSKYLGFANLPDEVIAACQDIRALPLTTGYILATLCSKGFKAPVVDMLPEIEVGRIAGRQLEELAANPEQLVKRALTSKQSDSTTNPGSSKPEAKHCVSPSGQSLFSINISQRRAVVTFTGQMRMLLGDEQFLDELQALVERAGCRLIQDR